MRIISCLPVMGFLSIILALTVACGEEKGTAELIVGEWDARNLDETMSIEFTEDGMALQEDQPPMRYRLTEGDTELLQILDEGSGEIFLELEVEFMDENSFTLSGRGMRVTLQRVR